MKIIYGMLSLLSLLIISFVMKTSAQELDGAILTGKKDSLYSNVLREMRELKVYVPDDNSELYAKQNYPVIYLLDGEAHFQSVTGMIHQMSIANGNELIPKMIVVGIGNTDRRRDLIPSKVINTPYLDSIRHVMTGGGDNFTTFMKNELIPFIEANYPTAPFRLLIGHSFGGLFTADILVNHPELFNAYVSIDPSIWLDDRKLLNEAKVVFKNEKLKGRSLYLAAANTLGPGADTAGIMKETRDHSLHLRTIIEFARLIEDNSQNGLRFKWKYYPDDDHTSVPLIAEYDAFRFIFDFYRFTDTFTLEKLKDHFLEVSKIMGYSVQPSERKVNIAGYNLLRSSEFDKALQYFTFNIENFPESFNVYDSMGDYYAATGNDAEAIKYFTKALSIKEFLPTRQKLDQLIVK